MRSYRSSFFSALPLLVDNLLLMRSIVLFMIILTASNHSIRAQSSENFKFRRYGIEHGLSHASAQSIIQDSLGYIWIGTLDGLNRFDGYSFTVFRNDPDDSTSLSDNRISSMIQDRQNRIWIGTVGGGLNLYNSKTQSFTHFKHDTNYPSSLSHDAITSIFQDLENRIWIGTEGGGLNLLNLPNQTFSHFLNDPNDTNTLSHNIVWSIIQDQGSNLWIGTQKGLNRFDPITETFSRFMHDSKNPNSLSNNRISSLLKDKKNRIWIGTEEGGLNLFKPESQSFSHFISEPNNPYSLNNNVVSSLFEDRENRIWIGTIGGGINLFDPESQTFTHFLNNPSNSLSISGNIIECFYQDNQKKIWIGTHEDGFNIMDPQTFHLFQNDPNNSKSLSNNHVYGIIQDHQRGLWVGTFEGLNLLKYQTSTFLRFYNDLLSSTSLSNNYILNVYQDREQRVWVGTYGGGLNLLDLQTKEFSHFQNDPNNLFSLSSNIVSCIFQDNQKRIWVGTLMGGLNLLNPKTKTFSRFQHDPNDSTTLSGNTIRCIFQDQHDRIWIGLRGGGLNLLDLQTKTFSRFQHDPNNPNSISDNGIWTIFQDHRNRIWLGTEGGLNLFDTKNFIFKSWREKDGLSNDVIYGILEDEKGNLWFSTNKGINKFNPETEKFKWYDKLDGLQSDGFSSFAFHKDKEGKMYFGGVNGLTMFHPDSIKDNTHIPPVVITDFLLFNKSVAISDTTVLKQALDYLSEITLNHDDYIFSFEFSSLNYHQPEKNQFAYKLEGFNEDWVFTDYKDRKATYTNVPPGAYTFRVKASNDDGYWNEDGASIEVIILPPWWLTWWAKTIWISILVTLLYSIYRIRVTELKKQKSRLEEEVKYRTQKIVHQKDEIQDQAEELKANNQKLLELGEYKEAMTSMIVHDFKNSLNTVISFSEGNPTKRRLKSIQQAGQFMLNMVLNILDVQKFETAEVKLALANYPISKVINEAINQLSYMIEQKSIQLIVDQNLGLFCRIDYELITRTIVNILSNAAKYVSTNGSIEITVQKVDHSILVSVKDDGPGIPANKIHLVFDKYSQINAKKSDSVRSTGIGLTFCKMVIEAHGGKIGVDSEESLGSNFHFTLPLIDSKIKEKEPIEKVIIQHNQSFKLTTKEKEMLHPYLKELRKWEVYDYSEVTAIIGEINLKENNIASWQEDLMKALYNGNEELYNELLKP